MNKGRVFFRIIVGGYLAYLGLGLIRDVMKDRPDNYMLYTAMGVVFLVIGVVWCALAVKKAVNHEYEEEIDDRPDEEEIDDQPDEEETDEVIETDDTEKNNE